MSDTMLLGVLRMPPSCWDDTSPLDVAQRYARYCQAADRIEGDLRLLRQAVLALADAAERDTSFLQDYEKLIAAIRVVSET